MGSSYLIDELLIGVTGFVLMIRAMISRIQLYEHLPSYVLPDSLIRTQGALEYFKTFMAS